MLRKYMMLEYDIPTMFLAKQTDCCADALAKLGCKCLLIILLHLLCTTALLEEDICGLCYFYHPLLSKLAKKEKTSYIFSFNWIYMPVHR